MKKSQLQQIIREEINNVLREEEPAEKEKVQGSADFSKIASGLSIELKDLIAVINYVKQGANLNAKQNKILADLMINLIKTGNDSLVQDFANQVKKLEVK
jgi:hypothetical protein